MMERVRILLVAAPAAPVRELTARLEDPDLDVLVCASAREVVDRLGATLPDVVVLDGTVPMSDVTLLYARLRATVAGAKVPIVFTSHTREVSDTFDADAPDFHLGPEAPLDEIEQLIFSFLPEALFDEIEPPAERAVEPDAPDGPDEPSPRDGGESPGDGGESPGDGGESPGRFEASGSATQGAEPGSTRRPAQSRVPVPPPDLDDEPAYPWGPPPEPTGPEHQGSPRLVAGRGVSRGADLGGGIGRRREPSDDVRQVPEPEPFRRSRRSGAPAADSRRASEPATPPFWPDLGARLRSGSVPAALVYLGLYALAELLAAVLDARLGMLLHGGLLLGMFFHGANVPPGTERAFLWALWLAPLTRIYQLARPFAGAEPLVWWALTAIPMVVAGVVAMRLAGQTPREAGLVPSLREAPVALVLVPIGLALGLLTHVLLEPAGPAQEMAAGRIWLAALVAIINPGVVDEIVFRGVLRRATTSLFGVGFAILYTSVLYAPVMPSGLLAGPSLTGLVVTFGTALLLATVTAKTGSVLGAATMHASLVLGLFVLGPFVMPVGVGPTVAPAAPATIEVSPQATRPAVIVASPGAVGQPGASPQPGQSTLPGQPGQPPLTPPVTLATPLPPPIAAPPGSVPSPGASGVGPAGQVAIVRGTGGAGARLRAQPGNAGPIVTVLPEGTPLVIIGPDRLVDGLVWRNVRALNAGEGWIAGQYVSTGQ